MESKFLTPVQLWQYFNPQQDPLKIAIVSNTDDGRFIRRALYFTALKNGEDEVRAYARIIMPNNLKNKQRFVLYIPDLDSHEQDEEYIKNIASRDFAVAVVDLRGEGTAATSYSEGYAYGRFCNAAQNRHNCTPSAESSPIFLWARILSRFLTVVESIYPKAKPLCIAERSGNELLWPLLAMDPRLYGGVTVLGSGLGSFLGFNRPEVSEDDDNAHKWEMALSPQAYIKFTTSPVLIVTAANHESGEFDRLDNLVRLLPEQSLCSTIVANRLCKQVTELANASMWRWVEGRYSARKELPKSPDMAYSVEDGKLVFRVTPDESIKKAAVVSLYYSYDEHNPEYRNWHCLTNKSEDDYLFEIKLCERDKVLYAYANVQYRDGVEIAATPIKVELGSLPLERRRLVPNKLLYDTDMENCFFAETEGIVLKDGVLCMKKCDKGILGVSVSCGKLATFSVNERRRINTDGKLQISAYSLIKKDIIISLTVLRENELRVFYTKETLEGTVGWQKLLLDVADFRDEKQRALDSWEEMKKLEIIDAEGVLFNNMLWV